jgi:hypothetical protein
VLLGKYWTGKHFQLPFPNSYITVNDHSVVLSVNPNSLLGGQSSGVGGGSKRFLYFGKQLLAALPLSQARSKGQTASDLKANCQ